MNEHDDQHDESMEDSESHVPGVELGEGGSDTEESFVTEEKKPFNRSTLVLFGIILAGLGGYYLMYLRTGPAKASAASAEALQADATIKEFLTDGQKIQVMEKMLRNTEKVVEQFKSYPSMTQIPLTDLQANPFKFVPLKAAVSDNGATVNTKKQEMEKAAAAKAANELQLQSIVHSGTHRACMINNTLYAEGQQVETFMIEKIQPGAVIVRSGTFRFQLTMKKKP
jgi:hypothetical protein